MTAQRGRVNLPGSRIQRDTVARMCIKQATSLEEAATFLAALGLPPLGSYCDSCGGRLRADNKYGACTRNPECRKIHQRRQFRVLYGKGDRKPVLAGVPGLRFIA